MSSRFVPFVSLCARAALSARNRFEVLLTRIGGVRSWSSGKRGVLPGVSPTDDPAATAAQGFTAVISVRSRPPSALLPRVRGATACEQGRGAGMTVRFPLGSPPSRRRRLTSYSIASDRNGAKGER